MVLMILDWKNAQTNEFKNATSYLNYTDPVPLTHEEGLKAALIDKNL